MNETIHCTLDGAIMKIRTLTAVILLICAAWGLSAGAVRADTVLYDSAGFIQGQQSFVQSFDLSSAGTLTVTLSTIPWLDTISGLTCFLTTSSGLIGTSMSAGTESISVGPAVIYAHWFGDAAGTAGIGVFGLNVKFQAGGSGAVPLPTSLLLFLSGIGMLWVARRRTIA
jgi:hypothetical protein